MPFAGYLASTGRFSLVLAATAGAVGCNVGSTLAYAVGARGGRPLVERWGRTILLSPGDLDRAERFFRRFGGPAVLSGRSGHRRQRPAYRSAQGRGAGG
jgi:membrane protein DedA with SNARE-associated domain